MSILEKVGALSSIGTKKNFPDAGALLSRIVSSVATAYTSTAAQVHTDSTGIKELIVSPVTAAGCLGINVSFAAPNDATAAAWFADTTTDSDVLLDAFIPAVVTEKFVFNTPLTRWDYQAVGAATTLRQRITR